jgi:hypothetical protein
MMNSTGRVGCHCAWAGVGVRAPEIPSPATAPNAMQVVREVMMPAPWFPHHFLFDDLCFPASNNAGRMAVSYLRLCRCRMVLRRHLHEL